MRDYHRMDAKLWASSNAYRKGFEDGQKYENHVPPHIIQLRAENGEILQTQAVIDELAEYGWKLIRLNECALAEARREGLRDAAEIARQAAETLYGRESRFPLVEKEIIRAIEDAAKP